MIIMAERDLKGVCPVFLAVGSGVALARRSEVECGARLAASRKPRQEALRFVEVDVIGLHS